MSHPVLIYAFAMVLLALFASFKGQTDFGILIVLIAILGELAIMQAREE